MSTPCLWPVSMERIFCHFPSLPSLPSSFWVGQAPRARPTSSSTPVKVEPEIEKNVLVERQNKQTSRYRSKATCGMIGKSINGVGSYRHESVDVLDGSSGHFTLVELLTILQYRYHHPGKTRRVVVKTAAAAPQSQSHTAPMCTWQPFVVAPGGDGDSGRTRTYVVWAVKGFTVILHDVVLLIIIDRIWRFDGRIRVNCPATRLAENTWLS